MCRRILLFIAFFCFAQAAFGAGHGVATIFGGNGQTTGFQNTYASQQLGYPFVVQGAATSGGPLAWLGIVHGQTLFPYAGNGISCQAQCLLGALVQFQSSVQNYNFVITACQSATPASIDGVTIQVDGRDIGHGSSSGFYQQTSNVGSEPCGSPVTYTWTIPVLSGNHYVVFYVNVQTSSININAASISATTGSVAAEPAGSRDATTQPLSSLNFWNTATGSAATWTSSGDTNTITFVGLTGALNSGIFSTPIYTGVATDPVGTVSYGTEGGQNIPLPITSVHMKTSWTVDPGSDASIAWVDNTNPRYWYEGNGCVVSTSPLGISCFGVTAFDQCDPALDKAYDQIISIGAIRQADITNGVIAHKLLLGLSFNEELPPSPQNVWAVKWPTQQSDFCAVAGTPCYTGTLPYGQTYGIPSTVNCNGLGLTSDGVIMCVGLQNYGAVQNISAGTSQVTFYAEGALSGSSHLNNMISDYNSILHSQMRIMTNQGPSSVNGGGTPLASALPGLAVCQGVN